MLSAPDAVLPTVLPGVLELAFMRRALLAALLVGLTAPLVGTFVVQRGLALVGDGLGHVALTGVGVGVLTGTAPVATALAVTVAAALTVDAVRARGRRGGDTALACVFYGGLAGGVVLLSLGPARGATLESYLFGSLTTTSARDLVLAAVLAATALAAVVLLRPLLFAATHDEEHARATGVPVRAAHALLAVLTSVTVVLSMRTAGLLLVSALLVVPVATARPLCRSTGAVLVLAPLLGALVSAGGLLLAYRAATPPGASTVLLALAVFAVVAVLAPRAGGWRQRP